MSTLIIGNKPFKILQINDLLDSFLSCIRCNMGIPNTNNGTIKDQLAICSHIYQNFIQQKSPWSTVTEVYGDEYKKEYLEYFCNNFSQEEYNRVWYADASKVQDAYNSFLRSHQCPYRFTKQPRTGYVCMFELLLTEVKPIIFGFSLTEETRKSYYVNNFVFEREDKNLSCHSKEDEVSILRWLHNHEMIDATLCMLKDEADPAIECNKLKPSDSMIELLEKTYGRLKIQ